MQTAPARTLAIECATEACSVALFEGNALLGHDHRELGRGHAERLVPMIAGLPDKGRADRILVSRGPGSFTGVRIGIATARALAYAWGAEIAAYPTLALVATMARSKLGAQRVLSCMTGGHGEWFVQPFSATGGAEAAHESLKPDAAIARFNAPIIAGSQAESFVNGKGSGQFFQALPDAQFVMQLPQPQLTCDISPLYGRAPDAKLPAQ